MLELSNKNTFTKDEKLCSAKAIDTLFSAGESFIAYPLRVVYLLHEESEFDRQNASVMISVSKRKFKRAVKRNRVKRLIREVYRLNKHDLIALLDRQNKHVDIAFLYLKDELPEFSEMEKSVLKAVSILTDKMEKRR
ncbi:MAG: ribonuclease P protein component [Dysgonomonas sp.]